MKALTLILLFYSLLGFAQENPWEPKKTENPWATEEVEENEEVKKENKIDTVSQEENTAETIKTNKDMKYHIRNTAKNNYKSGSDFGVGVATGLFLNLGGLFVDGLISLPTTKKEQAAIEKTASDSTYVELDPKEVEKETKKAIKGKRIFTSLGGTLAGSMAQIAILTGIIIFL
jgi:hypothetical protein